MSKVKFANVDDISQIMSLGYKSMAENNVGHIASVSFEKSLMTITLAVNNDVVLVKRNDLNPKLIDGVLGMKFAKTWFSEDTYLQTFLFYIKPEYRTFNLAKDFLSSVKEYGIINNTPIVFDLFAQKDVQKKIKLLKYMGFEDCGSIQVFKPKVKDIVQ